MTRAQTHQTVVNEGSNYNDLWETPPLVLADAMKQYDIHPTLDVCATFDNNKCDWYLGEELDSFDKEWDEDFFMNPPYSEINRWMKRAYEQHKKHNVNALILVFAKTSVKWWHKFVEGKAETHFQKGRIRFLLNGVEPRYCKHCKKRFARSISHCPICERKISKSTTRK